MPFCVPIRERESNFGFTLIELLVVIAIIAILSVVVILTLNPAQLLMQSRDANRVSDLATINSALGIYSAQGGSSLGSSSIIYVSIPDQTATSSFGDQCQGLNLPTAPSGTTYFCGSSSTYRTVNGNGWIPMNFSTLAGGAPFGQLPQDPTNQSSSNFYYTYSTNGSQYVVTAIPEAQKTKTQFGSNPVIPDYPDVMANGSNLTISPLWNPTGLVGYWPMDEGSGSSTTDSSGSGNAGTWEGTPIGNNSTYYTGGKVGGYAGAFNNDYILITTSSLLTGNTPLTVAFWVLFNNNTDTNNYLFSYGPAIANQDVYIYQHSPGDAIKFGDNGPGDLTGPSFEVPGIWYHVTVVYDGSKNYIYVNGALSTSISHTGLNLPASQACIGSACGGLPFRGSFDDFRIYNRALSASEVQALYNAQK